MRENIFGRQRELRILDEAWESDSSEFIAIYGRKRVGKTFLVKEYFDNTFAFYCEGIINEKKRSAQLKNFNAEIKNFGRHDLPEAKDWMDAFDNLKELLETSACNGKKVIFIDEIHSMATKNSGFLSALGHFWNRWASSRSDVLLIICGSATSWIVENILGNRGGLHNRVTKQFQMEPFRLDECEAFLISIGMSFSRYQIVQVYMILGGIPFYLKLLRPELSFQQNIDAIYFAPDAPLRNEYRFLFHSLYDQPERYLNVIEALAEKGIGLTFSEIAAKSSLGANGHLTKILSDLTECGFVRVYLGFGKTEKASLYQLIDPFVLFHLRFNNVSRRYVSDFWSHYSSTPAHSAWAGIAFEKACLLHIPQIKAALGISGVLTEAYSWRSRGEDAGTQIDLVLSRADNIIHLFEIKFYASPFTIDKEYSLKLKDKHALFAQETKTKKAAHITLLTTYGLTRNAYSGEILFQLTLDDLFTPIRQVF